MQSKATTVAAYLKQLPGERRALLEAVRNVILENVDRGIEERINYGMIGYVIPHSIYPAGYHCDPSKPFPYAGLASQKNYCSLYLFPVYNEAEDWFRREWQRGGKKLNMGKCCIRFKKVEDLNLAVLAKALKRFTISACLRSYERSLGKQATRLSGRAAVEVSPKLNTEVTKPKPHDAKDCGVKSSASRPVGSSGRSKAMGKFLEKVEGATAPKPLPHSAKNKSSAKSCRK